eukprot:7355320-Pyramimonas_sp.AAC.1
MHTDSAQMRSLHSAESDIGSPRHTSLPVSNNVAAPSEYDAPNNCLDSDTVSPHGKQLQNSSGNHSSFVQVPQRAALDAAAPETSTCSQHSSNRKHVGVEADKQEHTRSLTLHEAAIRGDIAALVDFLSSDSVNK